jgi:hypothetical protein
MFVEIKERLLWRRFFLETLKVIVVVSFDYFTHFSAGTRIRRE